MTHRARKVDANQPAIVRTLRQIPGVTVMILSDAGDGRPDLLVRSRAKRIYLVEIKDGAKKPSEQRLTDKEQKVSNEWGDDYVVVKSVDQAIRLVTT